MTQIFWPYNPNTITEGFGWSAWRQGIHDGIDFGIPQGTHVRATATGTIRNNDAGMKDGAGIDITTADGWLVRHWHINKFLLPNGTHVKAGDIIGLSGGQPGTWGAGNSTGAHIHWGIKIGTGWVDPAELNPANFDQPQPTPTRKKKLMGAYFRDASNGKIYYQDKPGAKLYLFGTYAEFSGYEKQGNNYVDLNKKDIAALIKKFGVINAK